MNNSNAKCRLMLLALVVTSISSFSPTGRVLADDVIVVPFQSEWKLFSPQGFLNDPGFLDPSFDTSWFDAGFDDSDWEGPRRGPFQYGDVNAFSRSDSFPLLDPGDGDRFTSYFRHEFVTTEPLSNLAIELLADDGAVFYLDGQAILHHNCCVDEFETVANDDFLNFSVRTGNEDSFLVRRILRGQELAPGNHVLAVSVHQAATISPDLGFEMRLLSQDNEGVILDSGIDTTLAQVGLNGPAEPHGAAGQNPDGVERWEWDGSDAGGENVGLLWFDIPQNVLDDFAFGQATLRLHVDNQGDSGDMFRMSVDWLSGPNGGDNVTWRNIPGGPGITLGGNTVRTSNMYTGELFRLEGQTIELDVTEDVIAWSLGEPNYGWAFLATGGDGAGITSFESLFDPIPELVIVPGDGGPRLQAGDADQDLDFDQLDLVQVLIAAKYLTGQPATWGEGDWNAAPGGKPGNPPPGDGVFDQVDLIAALGRDLFLSGPYAAIVEKGMPGDGQASLGYNADTGEVWIDAPLDTMLTSINIDSAAGIFTSDPARHLGGSFDNDADNNIFKATFGSSFGSLSFGQVAQAGLSEQFLLGDLSVVGSLAGGGPLGDVDLIYVPEPASLLALTLGLLALAGLRRR